MENFYLSRVLLEFRYGKYTFFSYKFNEFDFSKSFHPSSTFTSLMLVLVVYKEIESVFLHNHILKAFFLLFDIGMYVIMFEYTILY